MEKVLSFGSFIQSINEETQTMQKDEIDLKAKSGIPLKDKDPTGLSFSNIQKVYGKSDFDIRFKIAQALLLMGKNFFPLNVPNTPGAQKITEYFITPYIGEKGQNVKMEEISEPILRAIKPIVDDIGKDLKGYIEKKTASVKPIVKRVKVEIDKITQ